MYVVCEFLWNYVELYVKHTALRITSMNTREPVMTIINIHNSCYQSFDVGLMNQ